MQQEGIRIAVILGSVRPGNFTSKAAFLVLDELRKDARIQVDLIDPAGLQLSPPGAGGEEAAEKLQGRIAPSTGVILATPEYHGSYSSVMKIVIDNLGFPSVLAGKPVALLGVAAGQIGAIKALEHLRSVCSHIGAIVLPGPVSVPDVHRQFDENGACADPEVEQRIRSVATRLVEYIQGAVCPRIALEEMVRERDGESG